MKQRPASVAPKSENLIRDEGPSNSIEVMVRMRPLLEPYEDEVIWEVDEETNTIKSKVENIDLKSLNLTHPKFYNDFSSTQKFAFDNVLGPGSRTKDIYNKLLKKIVDSVVQGYNGTIFMYGQTTSGKTFTMLGTQKDPGILPHSLRTIFLTIPKMSDYKFTISVSYLEIYNEVINDLLVPGSSNLRILDDPKYGVTVKGLKRQEVASFEDAVYLMSFGEEHRKYRETNANEHSSRSHTIFQVFIESFQENTELGKKKRFSCLNLVDLAGSERLADNGGNEGQTGETGHINKSLFLLTNVIKKLADGKTSHIPYRDSKLTRILSNAVGGNSLTAVICAISPALQNFTQTLSTLRFASRAKRVRNAATENVEEAIMDQKLKQEVKNLREKLNKSEYQITRVNTLNVQLEDNLQMTRQEIRNLQKEMEDLRAVFGKGDNTRQMDDNLTNSSLLDIMNDDLPPTRPISRLRNHTHAPHISQSSELFFGDTIITLVEQVLNESGQDGTNASIDNPIAENPALKEWSSLCLKAKQTYLKDLRNLQKTFADSLEELSHKFVSKEQNPEVHQQIKSYATAEITKIDTIQDKISDYIKKVSPGSLKDVLTEKLEALAEKKSEEPSPKEQPLQESTEQTEGIERSEKNEKHEKGEKAEKNEKHEKHEKPSMSAAEEAISKKYELVLEKLEKKYDEIYSLVTQNLLREKDSSEESVSYDDPVHVKKYSFDSGCNSPSYNSLADDSMVLKEGGSATRRYRKLQDERPSSIGKTAPKFESSFARLKPERERKSISFIVEDSAYGNGYLWGSGKDGRLGNSKFSNESNPVAIRDLRFSKLVCGYHNSFGVSQEGLVYGWGRNENGQLGTGSNINTPIPINVTGFNKVSIIDIACGWQHCLALSVDGTLFSWGCGDEGQLGHGDDFDLAFPSEIRFFDKTQVVSIACGHSQSAAVTSEGSLYTWGHNSDYRLMNSSTRSVFIPTLTEFYKAKTQTLNDEGMEIVSLSMGATHMSLVTKNGNLYTAGRGHEGQLGVKLSKDMKTVESYRAENEESSEEILCSYFVQVPDFGSDKKAIMASCGEKYTLVLTEDKNVYSFGDARGGCLGFECNDKEKKIFKPTLIEKFQGMKIDTVVAGPRHAACISEDGELYCWGFNYYDQLEIGEIEKDHHIPKKIDKFAGQNVVTVSCGYFHTASLVKEK